MGKEGRATRARLGGLSPPRNGTGRRVKPPPFGRARPGLVREPPGGLGIPPSLPSLLRSSPPPVLAPRSREPLAGAGPQGAPCALTETSSRPGARGPLLGESLEAATRKRACDSPAAAGSGGEIRRPRPRHGPSPPSAPPPGAAAAECSARRRVRHKQTRLGRTWTAELLRLATDRGLRAPRLRAKGTAREGRRARRGRAPAASAPAPLRSPPLHGSAAAAAARAALQPAGASRQRVRTLRQGLSGTAASSPAPLRFLRKAETREPGGRREEGAEASGKSGSGHRGTAQPGGGCARGGGQSAQRRRRVAPSSGARRLRKSYSVPRASPRTCPGRCPRLTWPPEFPSPSPPLQPERGSAGLEHSRV